MKPGLKLYECHPAGRDPREMTQDELKAAGHEPMAPLQAPRARCLDCCGYQEKEVALCPAVDCPSWPFRMGTDPWRKSASEARREAARKAMTAINARRQKGGGTAPSGSPPDDGTAPVSAEGSEAALIWGTSRVDQAPEMVLHRAEGGSTGQSADQCQGGSIAVGDDVVTIFADAGDGRCPTTVKIGRRTLISAEAAAE
jgi:hypothetical protein